MNTESERPTHPIAFVNSQGNGQVITDDPCPTCGYPERHHVYAGDSLDLIADGCPSCETSRVVFVLVGELARDDAHRDLLPLPLAFDTRTAAEAYIESQQPLWGSHSLQCVPRYRAEHAKSCSNKNCRLEYAHAGPCWDRTLDPCPTCDKNNGHYPHCSRIDDQPCPKCGGDRLRADFTGSGSCHAHTRKEQGL